MWRSHLDESICSHYWGESTMRNIVYILLALSLVAALVGCRSTASHSLVVAGEVSTGRLIPALRAAPETHVAFTFKHEGVVESR